MSDKKPSREIHLVDSPGDAPGVNLGHGHPRAYRAEMHGGPLIEGHMAAQSKSAAPPPPPPPPTPGVKNIGRPTAPTKADD